jgi:PAS domain S-box-containing protein
VRHSKQSKEEAAARMRAGSTPLLDLAREYGVSTNTLRTWLKDSDARARAQDSAKRVATALSKEKYTSASQRQRLLMHALEQSPATIIVTDAEGKIVYANPKFVETTGYSVEEALGRNPRLLKSGETSPGEYRSLWKTITAGKEWHGTFHNRRKNGDLYWERASISPVFDADGQIANYMAVKEDITEYMQAEAARRKTAAGFHAVFAALPQGVIVFDGDCRILLSNRAAEELLDAELRSGTRLDSLNLRWLDAKGTALSLEKHPVTSALSGKVHGPALQLRLGVVPPTGGTQWIKASVSLINLPEEASTAALFVIEAA